jgi:DNA-binding NarL/FixJ family response regulator
MELHRRILMAQRNRLSNREEEVVGLLLEGKSNKLIASSLSISESKVEFNLKNIYTKHQVNSRTELILKLGKSQVPTRESGAFHSCGRRGRARK